MRRSRVLAIVAVGIVVFLIISALLARAFSADGAERSAITSLVQDEARGNLSGAVARVQNCQDDPACRAQIAANAAALRRSGSGSVSVLQLETSTSFSLGSTLGTARIAFRIGESRPIVQCVRVRRAGNVVTGLRVELLSVSGPKNGDAACPGMANAGP